MQIGTIKLGHDNRLAGTIDYHGRILRLLMKPLSKPTGPTHELLLNGMSTTPPSFAYAAKAPRHHTARHHALPRLQSHKRRRLPCRMVAPALIEPYRCQAAHHNLGAQSCLKTTSKPASPLT